MTTRSKLGGVYATSTIQAMDKQAHQTLKQLRALPGNKECAECKTSPSTWASVTLGVFVCMDCAQVHRNLGAHISKVKSCMGTYLWCPDELERMKEIGNARAWALYTGGAPPGTVIDKPASGSSFELRDRFARNKYESKKWLHPGGMAAVVAAERLGASSSVAAATRPSRMQKTGATSAKARRDARSKVQALRRGRTDTPRTRGDRLDADTQTLLASADQDDNDDWASAEWDSWSPQPRPPARIGHATAAAPPLPTPALAPAPSVETPPTDAFDAFFRECVGSSQGQTVSGNGDSGTDLIDLFAPAPAVTTGLLARQVSAH
jgi:hypothetical protein